MEQNKYKSLIKIIVIIISIIIVILFLYPKSKYIVKVLGNETNTPIEGVKVVMDFDYGWDRSETREFFTDKNGKVIISSKGVESDNLGMTGKLNHISVEKNSYHVNGVNSYQITKSHNYSIKLNKIDNPQKLISKRVVFYQNDKADFLTAIKNKDNSMLRNYPKELEMTDMDFDFPEISSKYKQANELGGFIGKIRFYGNGGIQELPKSGETNIGYDQKYALENIKGAPADNYEKELELYSGAEYVAKMSDGKHYFKFSTFFSKSTSGESYLEINTYIQPEENNNLETDSLEISNENSDKEKSSLQKTPTENKTEGINESKEIIIKSPTNNYSYCPDDSMVVYGVVNNVINLDINNPMIVKRVPATFSDLEISLTPTDYSYTKSKILPIKTDKDGRWFLSETDASYFDSIFIADKNTRSTSYIRYKTLPECEKDRIVDYGFFTMKIPAIYNSKIDYSYKDNEEIFATLNRSDLKDTSEGYYNNSINFTVLKGSKTDFLLEVYDLSHSDPNGKSIENLKINISGIEAYKISTNNEDLLLFYLDDKIIKIRLFNPESENVFKENIDIFKSLKAKSF